MEETLIDLLLEKINVFLLKCTWQRSFIRKTWKEHKRSKDMKESIEHLSNSTFIRCHSKYLGVFTIHMHLNVDNFLTIKWITCYSYVLMRLLIINLVVDDILAALQGKPMPTRLC